MKPSIVPPLVLCVCAVLSGQISAPPDQTQPSRPVYDKATKIWNLGIAHGTAEQVGEQINSEVRRLTKRVSELEHSLEQERANGQRFRGDARGHLRGTTAYQNKAAQVGDLERKLAEARRDHDSTNAIQFSSALNHAKADLSTMEADALWSNQAIRKSDQLAFTYADELSKMRTALNGATKWHDDLVDALKNTLTLSWPLSKGQAGLIGTMKPTDGVRKAVAELDGQQMANLLFDNAILMYATEWHEQTAQVEQITTNHVTRHPILARFPNGMTSLTEDTVVEVVAVDYDPPSAAILGGETTEAVMAVVRDSPLAELWREVNRK